MTQQNGPITTSQMVVDDGAIIQVIEQLKIMREAYIKALDDIIGRAKVLDSSLVKMGGTIEQQQKKVQQVAVEAENLARKNAEVRAEIESLTAKIAKLEAELEKFRKAQQEAATATQKTTAAQNEQAQATQQGTQSTTANTEAVKLNVSGLQGLKKEIESVIGTRDQNIKRLAKEQTALISVRNALNLLNKQQKNGLISLQEATHRRAELISQENQLKNTSRELTSIINAQTKEANAGLGTYQQLSKYLELLRIAMREAGKSAQDMNIVTKLQKEINMLEPQLRKFDASIGNHQRNVGNYASGFNTLGFQVQQVARELPSLTISAQQFFLAISNNLPMLADEIKRTSVHVKELRDQGQQVPGVFRQIVKSIVSWQTLLVVVITLVTAFGKEIAEMTKELFASSESFDATAKAQKRFRETMTQGQVDAQKSVTSLRLLYEATQNTTISINSRRKAVEELQRLYPAYFGQLTQEEILTGKAKGAYDKLRTSILEIARARAAVNAITENSEKELKITNTPGYNEMETYSKILDLAPGVKITQSPDAIRKSLNYAIGELQKIYPQLAKELKGSIGLTEGSGVAMIDAAARFNAQMARVRELYRQAESKFKEANKDLYDEIKESGATPVQAVDALRQNTEILASEAEKVFLNIAPDAKLIEGSVAAIDAAIQELQEAQKRATNAIEYNKLQKPIDELDKRRKAITGEARSGSNLSKSEKEGARSLKQQEKEAEKAQKIEDQDNKARLRLQKQALAIELKTYQKGYEEQVKAAENAHREREINLTNAFESIKNITEADIAEYTQAIKDNNAALNKNLLDAQNNLAAQQLEVEKRTWELRLQALREGTTEYLQAQLQLISTEKAIALIRNAMLPEEQRQKDEDIEKSFDRQGDLLTGNARVEALNKDYAIRMSEIEAEEWKRSDRYITQERIKAAIKRNDALLKLAREGAIELGDDQMAILVNEQQRLTEQLKDTRGNHDSLLDLLFPKMKDEWRESLNAAVNFTVTKLQSVFEAQSRLAQQEIDLADERIDAARSVLDAEREAAANGYANNVAQAQRELALQKQTQEKLLRQQAQMQRAQQAIEALSQTSSLITATANIWAEFTKGTGLAGPFLAAAATAAMWASFAAAQIKAAQVTRQSASAGAVTYGTGGYEYITGGSHQSGRDVSLGRTQDGRERRIEGGEFLGVINKRATRKYGSELGAIIDSINHGEFERIYMRSAFSFEKAGITINQNADTARLAADVAAIRRQGERQIVSDGKGRIFIFKGNNTKIIKS